MLLNLKFGEYILLRRLAIGGQSEVFLAVKDGPNEYTRPIVIKALPTKNREDERLVDLFYREAFISSRFMHSNVINVHDARIIEDDHCMLMDFVNGQTVADIAQRGFQQKCPPTLKQVVQIMADACAGLAYVHDFQALDHTRYSVVHLDVSPQNIMVTYQGVGMIFDFGIAKIIGLDDRHPKLAGGKYAYMSPEQTRGADVDPRSDIFSLGVILYELATGYRLFRRNTPAQVIKAITEEEIQPPRTLRPEIPQYLERVIMRALARDPFERYQSALDFRNDLNQFLDMTGDGSDLRAGLGVYIAEMFKKERNEIASVLQQADHGQPEPSDTDLEQLSTEGVLRDPTMELLAPDAVKEAKAAREARLLADTTAAAHGSEPASQSVGDLAVEVEELRRRQRVLYAVIVLFAVIATLLGFAQLGGAAPPTVAQEPPKEAPPSP